MSKLIHTALSPNTEKDDVWIAFRTLVNPWTWKQEEVVEGVQNMLQKVTGMPYVSTVDSGRTALYTILKALGVGSRDSVALQAYTCVAVPEPILWLDADPIYIDCNNELTMDSDDLEAKLRSDTKAIIVQHTFGQPADMEAIMAIARARNIPVIEDCAHALGGTYETSANPLHHGKPLGSLADVCFFSFGRDKSISSVFGGAIATNSSELYKKITDIVETYPYPSSAWVVQQLIHPPLMALVKSTYNFLGLGKIILEIAKRLHIISKPVQQIELSGGQPSFVMHQFSPALAALAANQLTKLPRYAAHRQTLAKHYVSLLNTDPSGDPVVAPVFAPTYVPGHAYLRYTIFSSNPAEIFKKARAKGIHLGDWYITVLAPKGVNYGKVGYNLGSCPNAERLAKETLNLPTHIGITSEMVEKIASCIR